MPRPDHDHQRHLGESRPTGINKTVTTLENTCYTFATANFGFSDPNDTPANNFLAVDVTTDPVRSLITAWPCRRPIRPLATLPVVCWSSRRPIRLVAYASFTFQVEDDGGTANRGARPTPPRDHDHRCYLSQSRPDGCEQDGDDAGEYRLHLRHGDFGFSDPNDTPPNNFLAVKSRRYRRPVR